ncbi:MAG: MgtC/SapB family protein [Erysipelotrichaceae bacterium]|nr:MgtC/SapB family protein [Erysipelotrichaceae bacterium]
MTIGSLIGYERYSASKEAGVRTHAVVSLASCLLMIISQYGFVGAERFDAARIAAQAVSGIGFLGAGIIFVQRGTIQGLSTAAGMWATSAIGLAIGAGMYILGIFSAVLVYVIQFYLYRLFPYNPPRNVIEMLIKIKNDGSVEKVNQILRDINYTHSENQITIDENDNWVIRTEVMTHSGVNPNTIIEEFKKDPDVVSVRVL